MLFTIEILAFCILYFTFVFVYGLTIVSMLRFCESSMTITVSVDGWASVDKK